MTVERQQSLESETQVYVDLGGTTHLVGRLWTRTKSRKETASFEYDPAWLTHSERFSLEPALALGAGAFHTRAGKALFGAIGDSAPDRWGRVLMRRAERRRARMAGETPRSLRELDYLLMVNDEARQGALRFSRAAGEPFLANEAESRIPPLIMLGDLLSAADHLTRDADSEEDLLLLLAPGSSLGGARPKASVKDNDGFLSIAKFPHSADETNAVVWEAVALSLAEKAGILVPRWRIERVGQKPVLLLRRFDRTGGARIPFLSAMSILDADEGETRSYLEFVEALRRHGASPLEDMRMLWRRIVFSVLISNADDHLRNHGFLYEGTDGWRLAPAYDMNPVPTDIKPRELSTAIDLEDASASIELALSVAEHFELKRAEAQYIVREVGKAVSAWRKEAAGLGVAPSEIDRISSAFEHRDLALALSCSG